MMAAVGTSAAVRTSRTPGSSRARLASMPARRAWAWGERSTAACSIPGTRTSSTKRPAPVTSRSPPSRAWLSPIISTRSPGAPRVPRGATSVRRHRGAPGVPRGATSVGGYRGAPGVPRGATSVGGCGGGHSGAPHEIDEIEEVEPAGRVPELRQHDGGLAPVLGGVVHLVDHLLPERVGPALALHVRVLDDAGEVGLGQRRHERLRVALDGLPARADGCEVGEVGGGKGRARRAAVPALEVQPLGAHGVHEGVADRVEAGAAALEELLARQPRARVEDAAVRPVVVAV